MKKPHVICLMMSSLDGKILTENWGQDKDIKRFTSLYETFHDSFDSDAWMVGRVTLEKDFTDGKKPDLSTAKQKIERTVFVGDDKAKSFAIAVDTKGKLGWETNELGGDHIIQVLTESISDNYLQYLQDKKISYVFAGKSDIDFSLALRQITEHFPIKTIMLEGGGHINGSMFQNGLIDEVNLLLIPLIDGSSDAPSSFEIKEIDKKVKQSLSLKNTKTLEHDVIWLTYEVNKQ